MGPNCCYLKADALTKIEINTSFNLTNKLEKYGEQYYSMVQGMK